MLKATAIGVVIVAFAVVGILATRDKAPSTQEVTARPTAAASAPAPPKAAPPPARTERPDRAAVPPKPRRLSSKKPPAAAAPDLVVKEDGTTEFTMPGPLPEPFVEPKQAIRLTPEEKLKLRPIDRDLTLAIRLSKGAQPAIEAAVKEYERSVTRVLGADRAQMLMAAMESEGRRLVESGVDPAEALGAAGQER